MDLEATLAQVAELVDGHRLPAAERLLADLLTERALAAATPGQRCRVYLEWGWIHGATQRYEIAREALAAAVAAAEPLRPRNLLCEALRESGLVARYEGDFGEAGRLLERSELVARQEGYHHELGQALFLRATVAHHLAAFPQAAALLREAAAVASRCPPGHASAQLRADICREQAVSARVARDYDTARRLLAEARDGYQRLGRRVGVANADRELGAVLQQVADDAGARQHYFRAFAGYLRAGRRIGAAQVARRVGHLDLTAGEDPAALARAERRFAQSLRLGGGEPTNAALTTLFLGQLARRRGDLDAAERLLDEAARSYAATGPGHDLARSLSQVALEYGLVARDRGDRARAIELFREALRPLREADDPGPASLAHYHLAFELIQDDEVAEALPHAVASFRLNEADGRRLRDPAERRFFYREHRATYGLAMHCATRAGDGRTAFAIAMAARAEALSAFVRAGARLAPQLQALIDEIALTAAETEREPGHDGRAAARLEELYTRLAHQTSQQMRQAMTGRGTDPDQVIATLPEGGHALLLDVLEEDDTICQRVWVSPDGQVTADEVIFPQAVRRFLDSYQQTGDAAAWRPQQRELAELGQAALPPGLAAALASGANPPLVISTGSLLAPVPVAALRINGRHLAEQAQLAVVPSMALWSALRTRPGRPARPGRGTLAFGDSALPSWRRESAALHAALAPVRLVGSGQLRSSLADAGDYAAVVISAHGTAPEPSPPAGHGDDQHAGLAQGLVLPDGERLTAADLLTCRLPEAVIIPACWSARLTVRAAVEPLGLPTAALAAGARWVLAGAVDIGDTTTASLMTVFYQGLRAGLAPSAALQRAQVRFLGTRPRTAPGTWAGLTVVGDGFTPLLLPCTGPQPQNPGGARVTQPEADLILANGKIRSPAHPSRFVQALAARDGVIVALGTDDEITELRGPRTRVIDLRGRLALPAFGDAHVHAVSGGLESLRCNLLGLRTRHDCLAAVAAYGEKLPAGGWVLGGGWALESFPGGTPAAADLDAVTGGRPAFIPNRDHHSAWVNTEALRRAGVTRDTPDPADGRIERDAAGHPAGTLHDGAMRLVGRHVPAASPAELTEGLLAAQAYLHSLGITSWQDACVGAADELGIPDAFEAYRRAAADGLLTADVTGALWWDRTRGLAQLEDLLTRRERAREGRFRATSVKLMLDGVCETGTAAMSAPYLDRDGHSTGHRGKLFIEPGELRDVTGRLAAEGFQLHFHALGDLAVTTALDALEALPPQRRSAGRHHLAHLQFIVPRDMNRFRELDAVANFQPLWACSDPQMEELTLPFVGPERALWQYQIGALARRGARIAFGSDWPVSTPDPLQEMHVAANRVLSERQGQPGTPECDKPFQLGQAVLLEDAVDAFTTGVAWVNHAEDVTGQLLPGMRADVAVLDQDLYSMPASGIGSTSVILTVAAGKVVAGQEE